MAENKNHIPFTITLLVIGWGLLIVVNALRADWSGPTEVPPGGNPSSFLTSGSNAETKTGPLTISNNFFVTGNVNLGSTSTPTSARLVIDPYTNASVDAGSGFIRTGYIAAHNYDVINKAYLYSSLEASSYWILSTSTNSLYPTSTSWNVGIGTTNPGTAKLAVMGGNVGIGTTAPAGKLHAFTTLNGSDATNNSGIFESSGGNSIVSIRSKDSGSYAALYGGFGTDMVGALDFRPTSGDMSFWTNPVGSNSWNERMRIKNSSGNVGIGTTNPLAKLHIVTSYNNVFRFNDGASNITPNISIGGSSTKSMALLTGSSGSVFTFDNTGFFGIYSDSKANIDAGTSAGGTSRMVVTSAGNVGIGTTGPSALLAVNGNVIGSTPTADNHLATKAYVDSAATSLWINSGQYLYPTSTSWRVGIGTTSPIAALHIYPKTGREGLRIVSSDYSPLVVRNSTDLDDLFRVNQSGDVTAVTSSATRMRSNNYCDATGNNCFDPSGGWSTDITTIFLTSTSTAGSFIFSSSVGYDAGNKICNSEQSGSHFCRTDEIIYLIQKNGTSSFSSMNGQNAWMADGPPGYTGAAAADDCSGWQDSTINSLGHFWIFSTAGGGKGALVNCSTVKKIACCK